MLCKNLHPKHQPRYIAVRKNSREDIGAKDCQECIRSKKERRENYADAINLNVF